MSGNTDISNLFDDQVARGVRAARTARSESQVALAARAGVSRSTLIAIEAGRGAQSGSMARVLEALGLSLVIGTDPPVQSSRMERKLARLEADAKARDRREAHVQLAARLLANEGRTRKSLQDAKRMVALWRKTGSCSPAYADAWEKILDGPPAQVGRNLVSLEASWANALLQNTPFSGALALQDDAPAA